MKRISDVYAARSQRLKVSLIEDRLDKIEEKVFKSGKTPTSVNQQMLLLSELGILKEFQKLGLTDNKLAGLLSIILNGDKDNIRKALSKMNLKDSNIKSSLNFAFIHKTFDEAGLKELAEKADLEFNRIKDLEE